MEKALLFHKISIILYFVISICLFIFAISFTTPLFQTRLYGNVELLTYYEEDLQVFNRYIFNFSIFYILVSVLFILLKLTKYFTGKILFPVSIILSFVSLYGSITSIIKCNKIKDFYTLYNYSSINKLSNYTISSTYFNSYNLVNILMGISSICLITAFIIGFIFYMKHEGDGNEEK